MKSLRLHLVVLGGLFSLALNPTAVEASDCSAKVSFDNVEQDSDGRNWRLTFEVEVEGCTYSGGRFDFDIEIRSTEQDETKTHKKAEAWTFNDKDSGEVEHEILLGSEEEVVGAEVDESSVKCTCRG